MLDFFVIYLILWWLVFFVMLPFGVERDHDVRFGNDPGAPKKSLVKKKSNYFIFCNINFDFSCYCNKK